MQNTIIKTQLAVDQDGQLPADLLAAETGLSKQRIKLAMHNGAVWLAREGKPRRIRRASKALKGGDELIIYYNAAIIDETPFEAKLIADEGTYSVWHKPRGMASQGSKWGDHCSISRWVEQHIQPQRPAFLVHRLDRAASGLILIAHQKRSAAALAAQFQQRKVSKRYRVAVHGLFEETGEQLTIAEPLDERDAITHVSLVSQDSEQNRALLDVVIETGRKHQIRRHLSDAGHPVVGDRLYGAGYATEDLQLTACFIEFCCPERQAPIQFLLSDELLPAL